MRRALALIEQAFADHRPALMFSGGMDSSVLLDLVYRYTEHRPPLIYVHNEIQNPATLSFVTERAAHYGAELTVATPDRTAFEQWQAQGWPILGPKPSRQWMNKYRHLGIRINYEACCGRMKIKPGRNATKAIGCDAQLTGIRATDDANRGRVLHEHGNCYLTNGLMIYHPLSHWTDLMVRRYRRQHDIPQDPTSAPGEWNGCRCCAGAWRFTGNAIERLRRRDLAHWREFIIEQGAWLPLLVVKYHQPARIIEAAVARLGGIEAIAERYGHIFDFCQIPPMTGYSKD